jgi:chemotaxis protein CheC
MKAPEGFTPVQLDTLRELLNIGFGKASVALSGISDCRIVLKVPDVQILPLSEIPGTMNLETRKSQACFAVEQTFSGRFSGSALLLIPGIHIASLSRGYPLEQADGVVVADSQILAEETATETGNIVMESCTGTLADLLDCRISFRPPRLVNPETEPAMMAVRIEKEGSAGILCRTAFSFGQEEVPGFLFIALSGASIAWLQDALDKYLAALV